jgi:hypothetical protein
MKQAAGSDPGGFSVSKVLATIDFRMVEPTLDIASDQRMRFDDDDARYDASI